jgi:cobalt-zinc-cadmium efflux system outer membrane protein
MKNPVVWFGFACAGVVFPWGAGLAEPLDMASIFEKVDTRNVELKAARGGVEAAASEIDQAGLPPNPELEIGTENFGMAEAEVVVSQPLELGGKRRSRVAAATLGREEAELELASVRLRLHAEALRRCGGLVEVNAGIAVIDTMLSLALRDKRRVDRRIEAGAAMELDAIRSGVAVEEIRMRREA